MKKIAFLLLIVLGGLLSVRAELKPGANAPDFELKGVDGEMVSLNDFKSSEGVILIFTCNPCPFAKAYEQRIIKLHHKYASEGYPVVAVNPNDVDISPDDTMEKMLERAQEKEYPFAYLKDESQTVYKSYGATRTPHIYLLQRKGDKFKVAYVGAIDDNAMDASAVTKTYLEDAIGALQAGDKPDPAHTKAIGCTIKSKS